MLEKIRNVILEDSMNFPREAFEIKGVWRIDYRYRPNSLERNLTYSICIVQTELQGCCYVEYDNFSIDDSILGKDARYLRHSFNGIEIASLDSAASAIYGRLEPSASHTFSGTSSEKVVRRAEIICAEAARIADLYQKNKILNIGVMGNLTSLLTHKHGLEYVGSDFDLELVDTGINESKVLSGRNTLEYITSEHVVLATGMTLTTNTLQEIINKCESVGSPLVLFAATGSYLAQIYTRDFNVPSVISEFQPQYMFQGTSQIGITTNETSAKNLRKVHEEV